MKEEALNIVKKLKKEGYEAYFCGGAVRDRLLGLEPKDYDVATNATPEQVSAIFEDKMVKPVGEHFGVMLVTLSEHPVEVATFRRDSLESDGRRPDSVEFCGAKEDAFRRDLTINALFEDPISGEVIDYVGGVKDLEDGVIRFVGDPEQRIKEDHLRIMRVFRFASRFNFEIEVETSYNCLLNKVLLRKIAKERVVDEFEKILKYNNDQHLLFFSSIAYLILPKHFKNNRGFCKKGEFAPEVRVASFYLDQNIGAEKFVEAGFSKKFSKKVVGSLEILKILNAKVDSFIYTISQANLSFVKEFVNDPYFKDCLDFLGDSSLMDFWKEAYNKYNGKLPEPLINGHDVISNFTEIEKEDIGEVLSVVREEQLSERINTKEEAFEIIGKYFLDLASKRVKIQSEQK